MQSVGTVAYGNRYNVRRTTTTGRCMVNVLFLALYDHVTAGENKETVITAHAFWVEVLPCWAEYFVPLLDRAYILGKPSGCNRRNQSPGALGEQQSASQTCSWMLRTFWREGFLPSLLCSLKRVRCGRLINRHHIWLTSHWHIPGGFMGSPCRRAIMVARSLGAAGCTDVWLVEPATGVVGVGVIGGWVWP